MNTIQFNINNNDNDNSHNILINRDDICLNFKPDTKDFTFTNDNIKLAADLRYDNITTTDKIKQRFICQVIKDKVLKTMYFDEFYGVNFEFFEVHNKKTRIDISDIKKDIEVIKETNNVKECYRMLYEFYPKDVINDLERRRYNSHNIGSKLVNKEIAKLNMIINSYQKKYFEDFNQDKQKELLKYKDSDDKASYIIPFYIQVYDFKINQFQYYRFYDAGQFHSLFHKDLSKINYIDNVFMIKIFNNYKILNDFLNNMQPIQNFLNIKNKHLLILHLNLSYNDIKLYNQYMSDLHIQIIPALTSKINVKGLLNEVLYTKAMLLAKNQLVIDIDSINKQQLLSSLDLYNRKECKHLLKFYNNNQDLIAKINDKVQRLIKEEDNNDSDSD